MAELSNGARWQDGIERRLEQNTDALNTLALRMQQQADRLDNVLEGFKGTKADIEKLTERVDAQAEFIGKAKWGIALVAAFGAAVWDVVKTWAQKQFT